MRPCLPHSDCHIPIHLNDQGPQKNSKYMPMTLSLAGVSAVTSPHTCQVRGLASRPPLPVETADVFPVSGVLNRKANLLRHFYKYSLDTPYAEFAGTSPDYCPRTRCRFPFVVAHCLLCLLMATASKIRRNADRVRLCPRKTSLPNAAKVPYGRASLNWNDCWINCVPTTLWWWPSWIN